MIITKRSGLLKNISFSFRVAKKLLQRSMLFAAHAFFLSWLGSGLILMLRFQIEGESDLGNIALVIQLTLLLVGICHLTLRPALPMLTRCVDRKDGKELIYLSVLSKTVIFLGGAAWFCCLYMVQPILSLVFDNSYPKAADTLGWSIFIVLPTTIHLICCQILIAYTSYRTILLSSLTGLAVFAGLLGLTENHDSADVIILFWALAYLVAMSVTAIGCAKKMHYLLFSDLFLPLLILMMTLLVPLMMGISTPIWQLLVRILALGLAFALYCLFINRRNFSSSKIVS
jgi:O-antigen/teichoic acid export membrane protein